MSEEEMEVTCDFCWEKIDQRYKEDGDYRTTLACGEQAHVKCAAENLTRLCVNERCGMMTNTDSDHCPECCGDVKEITIEEARRLITGK